MHECGDTFSGHVFFPFRNSYFTHISIFDMSSYSHVLFMTTTV